MRPRKFRYMVGDFETTVYKGQVNTEVWASACVDLYSEDVKLFHSIDEQFQYLVSLKENICIYYHNLKFDGSFWLSYFITELHYKQAYNKLNDEGTQVEWIHDKYMEPNTFKYSISDKGQWYDIIVRTSYATIEIRDSLKLLPFSVKQIGKGFKTKHQKLDMEYTGVRYAGCIITDEEAEYIKNDVLVVKEALETMFDEGHNKLTIGSCCLSEYKKIVGKVDYKVMFPDQYEYDINQNTFRYPSAGEYVRHSYKGGWCYVVKGKENKVKHGGVTADVNSLYPSMMHSESGNRYPIGNPIFWSGNSIPDKALKMNKYYFVRIKTRFYIKDGYLPFIQIKGNCLYRGTECLESSDIYDKKTGKYYDHYYDRHGVLHDTRVEMVLTMTDFELIKEHYELVDFEILDGCYYQAITGLFDEYIDKYKKIKVTSKGAKRQLAKLFLNNLYGKMASSTDSSFKLAFEKDNGALGFIGVEEHNKQAGYIPVGSAITSYARNFTIRAAQKNYHGVDNRGFIYADTDSIHCDLAPEDVVGIKVHESDFCCWKLESYWDEAIFTRQKTYIEHVTHEDGEPIETPYYNVKCAGMPEKCKQLFIKSVTGYTQEEYKEMTEEEKEFVKTKRKITDFKVGLTVPGKLMPVRIRGGVLLVDTMYQMHSI